MTRSLALFPLTLAALTLSGCGTAPPPSDQVLVEVGGKAITRRDVAVELSVNGLPARDRAAAGIALDSLVDRELLDRVAEERRIDRSPEYLGRMRRARAVLLVTLLREQIAARTPRPTPVEVARYIAEHPWAFERRLQLRVEQLATDARADDTTRLANQPSLAGAAALLSAGGRTATRSTQAYDTTRMPPRDAAMLAAQPLGAPIVVPDKGATRLVAVVERSPAPLSGDNAARAAMAMIREQRIDAELARLLSAARASTQVKYQAGEGPQQR